MASPVLIDTAPGSDDALALLLAWSSPEISVEAVTTVAGNVPVEQGMVNVFRLLALRQPTPRPVIAMGAAEPLARALVTGQRYHGEDGLGDLANWPETPKPPLEPDAVSVIIDQARRSQRLLTLVALGPLTNLALTLKADAGAVSLIGRIVAMGGAVDVPGNVTPTAEFNMYVDPEAAHRVLAARLPLHLVPLDATRHAVLPRAGIRSALRRATGPLAERVVAAASATRSCTVATAHARRRGETVTGGTLLVGDGGKGGNDAVAGRRLGAEVRFVPCVGEDASGYRLRAALQKEGIGVAGVSMTDRAATGTALIVVDAAGRNQIAVAPGANWALTVEMVERRVDDLAWAEIVMCQLETPVATVAWVLGEARRRGRLSLLNPAPMRDEARELVALADYLTPNETEAERLSGVAVRDPASAAVAARALRTRGASTVIVTRGAQGALACTADGQVSIPALPVAVVDTTAAGDAFNPSLAVALGEARALPDALRFASATAALACTRRGAQPSLPRRDEVETLLGA